MEQEIIDFNPFEPIFTYDEGYYTLSKDSEPMTDDDWDEWLENDLR